METMEQGAAQPAKTGTLQGKTFTKQGPTASEAQAGTADQPNAAIEKAAIDATLGVGFDKVIAAVKAGQTAQRIQWKGQMSLVGNKDKDGKIVGLSMKTSAGVSQAGLHNLDLLATDWKII